MDKNEIKGTARDVVGHGKDAVGGLSGDLGLQAEGKIDQVAGTMQKTFGGTVDDAREAASGLADAVSKAAQGADRTIRDASDRAGRTASDIAAGASNATQDARRRAERAIGRQPGLSLAGIAVLGAVFGYVSALLIQRGR